MLTTFEEKRIKQELNNCKTVREVFDYLNKNFKTEECELGFLTKGIYIDGVIKSINALNPKRR